MRNIGEFKITDILPEYKNKDGDTIKTMFNPSENPGWKLSEDGKTVEYNGNAKNSTIIEIPHLKLHAPGLQSFANIKNDVEMELTPFMKGKNEPVMKDTASISNYFKLPDKPEPEIPTPSPDNPPEKPGEHPTPTPGWVGVDFYKVAATVHNENGHSFFYDIKKERNLEFSWYLAYKWSGKDLKDITIIDNNLDSRMYYSGFTPNSDFIGGILEAYDSSDNLIFADKIKNGSKIKFPEDVAKNISYVKINKQGFSIEKNQSSILIHTKLREPNKYQFDDTPGSTNNIFENHAEMTFTLKDGQESTIQSSDNIGIRWLKQDIKAFKDTTFTGEHIYVENKGSYTIGVKKESEKISDKMEDFELVDLLPDGLEVKSIEILEPFNSDKSVTHEIVQNYNSSGKNAIVFKAKELAYYENSYNRMSIARINVEVDDTIIEGAFTNEAYLKVSNPNFKLINKVNFGDKEYSKASVSNYVLKAEELTSRTYIKKAGDVFWSKNGIEIDSNEEFEYRLSVFNNTPVNRTNMSIISVLPHIGDTALTQDNDGRYIDRGSEMVNKFNYKKGVTVPEGYTVYYLNESWKGMTDTIDNIDKALNWETTPSEKTTAIKIVANPGVVLKGQAEFHAIIPMVAPDNSDLSISGKKAWASFVRKDDQSFRYIEPNRVYNKMKAPTGTITLKKVGYDRNYQKLLELKGVMFELRDANDNIIRAAVSNNEGLVTFSELDLKKDYKVVETHTLNGYVKNEKPIEISSADFLKSPKYIYNIGNVVNNRISEKLQPILGTIKLNKIDFEGKPLKGVKFNLKGGNKFDEPVNITVASDEQGDVYFSDIPYGKYVLTEIKHGLLKPIEPKELSVTKPHQVIDLGKIINDKIELNLFKVGVYKQPDVAIHNFDGSKEPKLMGVKFSLYQGNKLIKDNLISNYEGLIKIEDIDFNTVYTLKEVEAPKGYLKIFDEVKFKVSGDEKVLTENDEPFLSSDIYIPNLIKANIDIVKLGVLDTQKNKKLVDFYSIDGTKLENAEFELYQGNELLMSDLKTNKDGLIKLRNLEYDTKYTLKEVKAPANYLIVHDEIMFELKKDGTRLISNEGALRGGTLYIPNILDGIPSDINIKKTDKVTGLPLKDAVFALYKVENNKNIFVQESTSDAEGMAYFKGVGHGTYRVMETKAPKGYVIDAKEETIIVDKYKPKTFELTYKDTPLSLDINKVSYVAQAVTKEEADMLKESDATCIVVQNKTLYDVYKPVGDVKFEIVDLSNNEIVETVVSTSDGAVNLNAKLYDASKVYRIVEVSAPNKYEINRSGWNINLRDLQKQKDFDGNVRMILNNRLLKGQIIVSKYDKSTKTTIPGVEFTLYDANEQKIKTMLTDSYGIAKFSNLTVGTYYIEETKPAPNYEAKAGKVKIEITKDALVKTHVLYNKKNISFTLPTSGLLEEYYSIMFIFALIAIAFVYRRRFVRIEK